MEGKKGREDFLWIDRVLGDIPLVYSTTNFLKYSLSEALERIAAGGDKAVVLLTGCELLHPYYRTRAIESALVGRVPHPTVILYPGRRVGQYGLHFLGFYPEDGNYRSTLIGGLE